MIHKQRYRYSDLNKLDMKTTTSISRKPLKLVNTFGIYFIEIIYETNNTHFTRVLLCNYQEKNHC